MKHCTNELGDEIAARTNNVLNTVLSGTYELGDENAARKKAEEEQQRIRMEEVPSTNTVLTKYLLSTNSQTHY